MFNRGRRSDSGDMLSMSDVSRGKDKDKSRTHLRRNLWRIGRRGSHAIRVEAPCQWTRFNEVLSCASWTFPTSKDEGRFIHVRFSVYSPFFTAWTMKLICPNIGGFWRYRSMPSGGRIASDGSSGWFRSSWKFLAGMETCKIRQVWSEACLNAFFLINLNPPSTYVGICLQGDRWSLLMLFGVRMLWVEAVHLRCRLKSRMNLKEDLLISSRRVAVCASWWIWPLRYRLEVDRAGLKRNCSHSAHFDQLTDSRCYMATPLGVIGNRSPIFVQEYRVHSVDFTTSCLFALRAYVALSPPAQVVVRLLSGIAIVSRFPSSSWLAFDNGAAFWRSMLFLLGCFAARGCYGRRRALILIKEGAHYVRWQLCWPV